MDSVLGERPYVTYDDVGKLEYLGQVIKETLRLFPPVAVTFRQPSKRHHVGGYTVPAGTMVMVMMCIVTEEVLRTQNIIM